MFRNKTHAAGESPIVLRKAFIPFTLFVTAMSVGTFTYAEEKVDVHAKVFEASDFPSAKECATCHARVYEQWRASSHAYAFVSPTFHAFEQVIDKLTAGTKGSFCVGCHSAVSRLTGEDRRDPLWKSSPIAQEGISCVTCHRVANTYTKVNGERRINPGDITAPVKGPFSGKGVKKVIENADYYKVVSKPGEPGMQIHSKAIKFEQINKSEFCVSCHQVQIHPGIKLEVVWDQYRNGPAFKKGIICQDCHMGKTPGLANGYERGPAAEINGLTVNDKRKMTNHNFFGPSMPLAHPGLFPFNLANKDVDMQDWLTFEYRAGWGTDDFEKKVKNDKDKYKFPKAWKDPEDRYSAREIIDDNLKRLDEKNKQRIELFNNGSKVDGPFFSSKLTPGESLDFYYTVTNTSLGHNLPSGSLGAQPQIWLNVAMKDPDGKIIWESGDLDTYGDLRDLMSADVLAGKIPMDKQLFNLQSKFITTNIKGTDRENVLPVNFDGDQVALVRPANKPTALLNHPPFVRMEARSLAPLESRKAKFTVPGNLLTKAGTYKLAVRLRYRGEPIYFLKFINVGKEMISRYNETIASIHPYTVEFDLKS